MIWKILGLLLLIANGAFATLAIQEHRWIAALFNGSIFLYLFYLLVFRPIFTEVRKP